MRTRFGWPTHTHAFWWPAPFSLPSLDTQQVDGRDVSKRVVNNEKYTQLYTLSPHVPVDYAWLQRVPTMARRKPSSSIDRMAFLLFLDSLSLPLRKVWISFFQPMAVQPCSSAPLVCSCPVRFQWAHLHVFFRIYISFHLLFLSFLLFCAHCSWTNFAVPLAFWVPLNIPCGRW